MKTVRVVITHGVVGKEDVAPLVLDEEEAVGEDEQHGEDYQDHHQEATVQRTHGL